MSTIGGIYLNPNELDLIDGLVTAELGAFQVRVTEYHPTGSDATHRTRLGVRISTQANFSTSIWRYGVWKHIGFDCTTSKPDACTKVDLGYLQPNTKYYVRVFMQIEGGGNVAINSGLSFWTDRAPYAPVLLTPDNGDEFDGIEDITFSWLFSDPDEIAIPDQGIQSGYVLRYRTVATALAAPGAWTYYNAGGGTHSEQFLVLNSGIFAPNTGYEWQVITWDQSIGLNSPYSAAGTFSIVSSTTPPKLLDPIDNETFQAADDHRFIWQFQDPDETATQVQADLRYRVVGDVGWTTLTGAGATPGTDQFWDIAGATFDPHTHYEWQVRTTSSLAVTTAWSPSEFFWALAVGEDGGGLFPDITEAQRSLGVGDNHAFIYDRGGETRRGEVKPIAHLQWTRKRDDISTALITTNGFGDDNGQLLREIRTWRHEIVIYRDGVRVWEGPIVRIEWDVDKVVIEAHDVMAYVYRRIMRRGYNDSYRVVEGIQLGLHTVVYRARQIIMDALGRDDPNVLAYLTALMFSDDAKTSRIVPAYIKSAWQEIDDLAATAGLDYTVMGRRIVLNDTHRAVGRLAEMGDGDFSEPPKVTEYGMQAANEFAVTNNDGVYGIATRLTYIAGVPVIPEEGMIEQIASSYGESSGVVSESMTAAQRAALVATLKAQAERNISHRWPAPVLVRIPDNATLFPEVNVSINELIPGVWIPLRAGKSLRTVTQLQKLDAVTVIQGGGQAEKISVTMGPAPAAGEDDTDGGTEV